MPQVHLISLPRVLRRSARAAPRRGQALPEFAMVLLPVLLIVVGTILFGLLFNANVTLTNAAREAARAGSIYLYVGNSQANNDRDRCTAVVQATKSSLGLLSAGSPHFTVADPCTAAHRVSDHLWVNGDVTIAYCRPVSGTPGPGECAASSPVLANDQRRGYRMTVTVAYRSDIIVPLIGGLLNTDANGRFQQKASATMVVN
jgi:Flp pilus assembly protein TadG